MSQAFSSDQYFRILDSSPDHVFIFNSEGKYVDVFGGHENGIGFDCKAYVGQSLHDVMPTTLADLFLKTIQTALSSQKTQRISYQFNQQQLQDLPYSSSSPELWIESILKPFTLDSGEQVVIWNARNITEKHHLEQKLRQLSEIDTLTGILNRRAFMNCLSDKVESFQIFGMNTSFLMLDIDRFKLVNDNFGHVIGDQVITHVTKTCQEELRKHDIFGRIGGEEFAIILHDADQDQAYEIAERLREAVDNNVCILDENTQVHTTISVGITQFQPTDTDNKFLLTRSDNAMYQSKKQGRNQVTIYDNSMHGNTD
ncbi:sensor domain-containing diguanylate cyclase [Vibrio nitrifigilis]|uniref:diguanylate cyclase n=1 Tax=Vibrio nitrifigilis TaxID=2789781 RepID=A0ABS0GIY9_9VIBR|nr:sensor domain-containing diguanylate cyclase [Vibrio nitrifigilis]MBF9002307.1 GGDEF domain-containing protein [Vibrio nitrifigilis]